MSEIRHNFDGIIDTVDLLVHDLIAAVSKYCLSVGGTSDFHVLAGTVWCKYGIPYDMILRHRDMAQP